ncbi:MAG: hypothetical protein N3A61_01250 [Ignavibacteria bacterium]|nr:hypothetical protein [Ignavibacteria bacterium]
MGFSPKKLKLINRCFDEQTFPFVDFSLDEIECVSNEPKFNKKLVYIKYEDSLKFKPHFGWVNHIEDF